MHTFTKFCFIITLVLSFSRFSSPNVGAAIGVGCPIEQNFTCFGSCTNKLWYDCSEYMGGKGCLVSYCVPCTDTVYPLDAQDCPFAYSEKDECPSFCIHQIEPYRGNPLDEDIFEADVNEELS